MDLYDHLAPCYDEIFPLNPATLPFLRGLTPRAHPRAADLGSATASLSRALAAEGWEVTALEPSEALTERARNYSGGLG
jgi:hypothetical protein